MRCKLLLSLVLALSPCAGFGATAASIGASAPLPISETTQIPGETLKAGTYSITIVDQLADRLIVRIDSAGSTKHAIFLGVPGTAEGLGSGVGPAFWASGLNKTATLRGFTFADGSRVEFVYAKSEAAALAKENSAKVMAVDPQSEGRTAIKNLSKDELQVVNLWMLSLTTTGVDHKTPAVLAQRWEGSRPDAPVVASSVKREGPVQVASVEREPIGAPGAVGGGTASRVARRRAVIAELPHTASLLPLVWMAGLLSLGAALALRLMRRVVA